MSKYNNVVNLIIFLFEFELSIKNFVIAGRTMNY